MIKMPDSNLRVWKIRIDDIQGLMRLGEAYTQSNIAPQVLAADKSGILHFGTLEKVLHQNPDGTVERDLVVRASGHELLFDDEIAGLYIAYIAQIQKY